MDKSNLTELITAFRNETQSEAITPDMLGSLLQQIVDANGNQPSAGGGTSANGITMYHIEAVVADEFVYILGASKLLAKGYVPYLFRRCVKKVRYRNAPRGRKHEKRKGWNRMGNHLAIKINPTSGLLQFNTMNHTVWHLCGHDKGPGIGDDYDCSADSLMQVNLANPATENVPWGMRMVNRHLENGDRPQDRMLRFPFAIAFAKERITPHTRQSEIDWLTNLAEFSVVFGCTEFDKQWHFSR